MDYFAHHTSIHTAAMYRQVLVIGIILTIAIGLAMLMARFSK